MKHLSKYYLLPAIALVLFGAVLGVQLDSYLSDDDMRDQVEKLQSAFLQINKNYVDPVDAQNMAEEGIDGMLDALDPHSTHIPAEQVKEVKDQYQGSFGGIGIMFEVVEDTARVISPIADGPSENVGVMAGDRIVQIEDTTAVPASASSIQDHLKGEIGSEVKMTVYRPLTNKRLTFTIERDEIPMYSINSSYMVGDETGYVEIDRFSMQTYDEFMTTVKELRSQGMERLVLDLRNNPGGVMQSAVKIADEMLSAGLTIVRTKGRSPQMDQRYRARDGGVMEEDPIIVLVNGNSASASEIITGALQDHDRALVVGRRTFGKALVQKQFDLDSGGLLQMTVGRYYTPVGRLIQTPYEKGDKRSYYKQKFSTIRDATFDLSSYRESIPDSLAYQTDNGRTVFGGGGILPDYVVQPDTSTLPYYVRNSGVDFGFVTRWFSQHEQEIRSQWRDREAEFRQSYTVSESTLSDFWTFADTTGAVTLTTDPEKVNPSERVYLKESAEEAEQVVATRIKGFLSRQLYGSRSARRILNQSDPVFEQAMSLWPSSQELATYHGFSMPAQSMRNDE
jgi:carboxyl-terminal processing protease